MNLASSELEADGKMAASDEDERGIVGIWLERMNEEVACQGGEFSEAF